MTRAGSDATRGTGPRPRPAPGSLLVAAVRGDVFDALRTRVRAEDLLVDHGVHRPLRDDPAPAAVDQRDDDGATLRSVGLAVGPVAHEFDLDFVAAVGVVDDDRLNPVAGREPSGRVVWGFD